MKKLIGFAAVIALATAAILFARGAGMSGRTIRIGVNDWPPCEVWQVAEAAGLFGELEVELVRFTSWGDNMRALYDGKIDITHATWFNAAYFADKGEGGTVIQVIDTVEGGDGFVVADGLDPLTELRGKRIAVEINTDEHFLLELALGDFGLSLADVEPVALTASEGYEAFVAGAVDALFTYEPFLSDAAAHGDGTIVWTTRERPGYMVDVLVARNSVIEGDSRAVGRLVEAWHGALGLIAAEPDRWYPLMAAAHEMPVEEFGPFFESFSFFTPADNRRMLTEAEGGERLEMMLSFLRNRNSTGYTGSTEALYTAEFTPEAAE